MEFHKTPQRVSQTLSAGLDHSEEALPEVDEPPDEKRSTSTFWSTFKPVPRLASFARAGPPNDRRESLLTRQLHSEAEHTEDEERIRLPSRGLSTVSTRSNTSAASTAELTSDDGKSVVSPSISPPLPPTQMRTSPHVKIDALANEPKIVGHDETTSPTATAPPPPSEKTVEAALGRRRCITFGCAAKDKPKASSPPVKEPEKPAEASPPKRKCMLKFVCPTRSTAEKPVAVAPQQTRRAVSPPPPERRSSVHKAHRGSDSTVTHASPRSLRKSPSTRETVPQVSRCRRFSLDSDDATPEGARFHEFGTSEDEPEEWTQQTGCHRSRLTISDTLAKENVIRKLGQEAEDEILEEVDEDEDDDVALDEEDEDNEDVDDDDDDDNDDDDLDIAEEDEDDDESDAGFRSDDEEGFANSDAESDASEDDWWRPGGISTAATSAEHLETVTWRPKADRRFSDASHASESSVGYHSPHSMSVVGKRFKPRKAINIDNVGAQDLPDSTDFVCGTLDEDRPLEQAYINCVKKKQLAKHRSVPQDIDPSFPASDPEVMDEEDDEDIEDPPESEAEQYGLMHGEMEELSEPERRRPSRSTRKSTAGRSPAPQTRHRSPAPARRSVHVSPPPPARHRSPAPRRSTQHSPPPIRNRSPAPRPSVQLPSPQRKLFGQSPRRLRSPPPAGRMTSPPNSRASSTNGEALIQMPHRGLAGRPSVNVTHTASVPRNGVFQLSKLATMDDHDDDGHSTDTAPNVPAEAPKRRAIDIVKGLEKKRQRRKEKLYQKHCAKTAAKGEKAHKVKPGKGAERMREVGLELQRYHGKGDHIISV